MDNIYHTRFYNYFRKTYFLIISIFIFTFFSCQKKHNPDHKLTAIHDVQKILKQQQIAWNKGDIVAFMEGYWKSDSLRFIGSKGLNYGWTNTLENYKKSYPDKATMGNLHFDVLNMEVLSEQCVWMIGKYTLTREKDQPSGLFTLIWKKIDGQWVIVSDQTCG